MQIKPDNNSNTETVIKSVVNTTENNEIKEDSIEYHVITRIASVYSDDEEYVTSPISNNIAMTYDAAVDEEKENFTANIIIM